MRVLNVFLAFAISALLAFSLFEAGLRLFPNYRPQPVLNQFDNRLGWSKTPGKTVSRGTAEFDVTFEINELGLRDESMASIRKPGGTLRVLMLGDSFVLGYTVDRKDLFVDHLERWWNEEGRRVEVLNAGTEGYSTDQEVLWFLDHGVDYEPDLVCIFPYENDIYWAGETAYHGNRAKPRFAPDGTLETGTLPDNAPKGSALQQLAFFHFLSKTIRPLLPSSKAISPYEFEPEGQSGTPVSIPKEFAPLLIDTPDFIDDAIGHTKGALIALQKGCKSIGARLIMVPLPSKSAIDPEARRKIAKLPSAMNGLDESLWSPDKPVELFLSMATELGIEAYDPRLALKRRAEEIDRPLYFEDDFHFNPAGNHAFALALHKSAEKRNWFSDAHSAQRQTHLAIAEPRGGLPTWMVPFAVLWVFLSVSFILTYRDENPALVFLKIAGMLGVVFLLVIGGGKLLDILPPAISTWILPGLILVLLSFVAYKLGRRMATILELMKAFALRGHWYLMPLVVVLLTIGSLLVVAASSPLIAPFIYTLF